MKIVTLYIASVLLLVATCKNQKSESENNSGQEQQTEMTSNHNSQNSLDWAGVYRGTLPCADCEGIKTEIKLDQDLSYVKAVKYMGKSDEFTRSTGTFTWDESGSTITLNEAQNSSYKVGENVLMALDGDGNRIMGALSDRYNLKKETMDMGITEKYWKLIELNGQEITTAENQKEIHMILKNEDSQVTGFSGCNRLNGVYELNDATGRLSFLKMKSTLMACDNMQTEDIFHKVLSKVDNYTLKNDTLSLSKARMAPLAKFEVVYLK